MPIAASQITNNPFDADFEARRRAAHGKMAGMNRRQAIIALSSLAAFPAAAFASPDDLRGDVAILRKALALHPGLYRYASPATVAGRLDRLEREFVATTTVEARYLLLSRFLATIRCGHSYCNFFNQREAVARPLFDRPTRLPFQFVWIDRRMIVTADPTGALARGTEILKINDLPAGVMLATLMQYARADGHNDAKRAALLGVAGGDRIEFFDVFHGLTYGAPHIGLHRLVVRLPDGAIAAREVLALGLAARQAQMVPRDYDGDQPVWSWTMRPDGVALLDMPGWALYDSKWDWRSWLDDRLRSLSGARGLIVDLRENEGGQDCGDALLARLANAPITDPDAERRVRFEQTPPEIDRYLDTWDKSFHRLGVGAEPIGGGFRRLVGQRGNAAIDPVGPRLDLPVAALIGPMNSSATFQFAEKARRTGLVRLFGEATGGNRRGINGGCFFFVRLPASGIEFDLPLIGYFPGGSPPDAGIAPDVLVPRTAADVANRLDRQMAAAANWILRA